MLISHLESFVDFYNSSNDVDQARVVMRLVFNINFEFGTISACANKDVNGTYYFVYLRFENSREKLPGKGFILFIDLWVELGNNGW